MLSVMSENRGHAAILRCSGRIVAGEEAWTLYNTVISQQGKRVVVLDLTGENFPALFPLLGSGSAQANCGTRGLQYSC